MPSFRRLPSWGHLLLIPFLIGCNQFHTKDLLESFDLKPQSTLEISEFKASPEEISAGQKILLEFKVSGATTLSLSPGNLDIDPTQTSFEITPSESTTFILTASNSTASISRAVSITVTPATLPPPGPPLDGPACTKPLELSQRGKVKFHPGHYVAIGSGRKIATRLTTTLQEIKDPSLSHVIGIQKRYYWSTMHGPTRDDFNFAQLRKDIEEVEAAGKKLSIMIMWKFSADNGENPVPRFLKDLSSPGIPYQFKVNSEARFTNSYIAYLGNPVVSKELIRFLRRLAAEVDNKSSVSSIVFAESSMGIKPEKYTPPIPGDEFKKILNSHVDGLLEVVKQASCIFKHTPVLPLTNFPIPRLPEFAETYAKWSIAMGGPDVWINDPSIEHAYKLYPALSEKVPIGVIVAGGNYLYSTHDAETVPVSERGPYLLSNPPYSWDEFTTVIKLAEKARTQLKVNYFFWKKNGDLGDKFYNAFKEEIKKVGTASETILPAATKCPSNFGSQCVNNLP